jgi:hypothetical protein
MDRAKVYSRCITAYHVLLATNAVGPQRDADAVTASILELYAAYALDRTNAAAQRHFNGLTNDADQRLALLATAASSAQIRQSAKEARSCLIQQFSRCARGWMSVQ